MAIRPVDIVKSQEASQLKYMESQKAQHAIDQAGKNYQNVVQQEQHRPTKAAKSEDTNYRYDAKEKGNNKYQSLGKKKKKENKDKEAANDHGSGGIDILI